VVVRLAVGRYDDPVMAPLTTAERRELAATLRRLVELVESGQLDASTARERRLLTYLAGVVAGLEDAAGASVRRSR
jgi:hypothetical protein